MFRLNGGRVIVITMNGRPIIASTIPVPGIQNEDDNYLAFA